MTEQEKGRVRLEVLEVTLLREHSRAPSSYVVVLFQPQQKKLLPIIIDYQVAYAIQIALERKKTLRPITHDLMKSVLDGFGIHVREVVISDFKNGIFYATLVCEKDGQIQEFDSRASDAIAMALRYGVPVYTYPQILEEAGMDMQTESSSEEELSTAEDSENVSEEAPAEVPQHPGTPSIDIEELKPEDLKDLPEDVLEKLMREAIQKELFEVAAWIRDELNARREHQQQQQHSRKGGTDSPESETNLPQA